MIKKRAEAFTLVELLVVIAIIGILSTLAVVSLQSARARARDAKRITDVRQIQMALEFYYNDWSHYPAAVVAGASIGSGTTIYMAQVPAGPTPADGDCVLSDYSYQQVNGGASYLMEFCLSAPTGSLSPGINCASPSGIVASTTSCF